MVFKTCITYSMNTSYRDPFKHYFDAEVRRTTDRSIIARRLLSIIEKTLPSLRPVEKDYGVVFKHGRRNIVSLFLHRNFITLKLCRGSYLKDPDGILLGSGRSTRMLRYYTLEDIDRNQTSYFLNQYK